MLLGYGYKRNNFARLGGYSTHRDAAAMSNLFYFYFVFVWSRRMTRLPRFHLSKQNGVNKCQYKHFGQPIETKIMRIRMYQLKLKKS